MDYSVLLLACAAGEMPNLLPGSLADRKSALFTLYEAALLSEKYDETEVELVSQSMQSTSDRIDAFSSSLFSDMSLVNIDNLSPFIPYSLYQAAIIQHRLFRQTGKQSHQQAIISLKSILDTFKQRWLIAGKIINAFMV